MAATANFTNLTRPATPAGNIDDGYWDIELPWNIYFLSTTQFGNTGSPFIFVTTNGVIGSGVGNAAVGSTSSSVTFTQPNVNKLIIAGADNIVTNFEYKVIGTAPNRKAYIKYQAYEYGNPPTTPPTIIWEVVFREQLSRSITFVNANVIANSRWTKPGQAKGLYGLYTSSSLVENPTNFGQPDIGYRFDFWQGSNYGRQSAQLLLPNYSSTIDKNRTLFIAGNSNTDFGSGTGVMMIAKPGLPVDALANPLNYVEDLHFHSGLPYIQILARLASAYPLTFPAVNRGVAEWQESGGGHGGH